MLTRKTVTLLLFAALALAGAYDALHNLPVLSGCNYYSDCPKTAPESVAHTSKE